MEGEMYNYAQVWLTVILSLCYCYIVVSKITQKGITRLCCVLPVVCLFLALPLKLHSPNLGGTTAFFIAWLANFKLLLFAFGKGPLCSEHISLATFVALACLPIKINNQQHESPSTVHKAPKSVLNYATKGLLVGVFIKIFDYSDRIHPKVVLFLYCFTIYFFLEIVLAVVAALARTVLGLHFEPPFDEPYLSTSLQDFWGRRWNLLVTSILRPTVYEPVRDFSSRAVGRSWAPLPAVMATFVVSGIMHELLFYYLGRVRPTWEITCFFLLHGGCLVAEIALKKLLAGKFRLPGVVSGTLTFGFVMVTGFWLFFPQLLRCNAFGRGLEEVAAASAVVNDVGFHLISTIRGLV